jgi:hypothetical protein
MVLKPTADLGRSHDTQLRGRDSDSHTAAATDATKRGQSQTVTRLLPHRIIYPFSARKHTSFDWRTGTESVTLAFPQSWTSCSEPACDDSYVPIAQDWADSDSDTEHESMRTPPESPPPEPSAHFIPSPQIILSQSANHLRRAYKPPPNRSRQYSVFPQVPSRSNRRLNGADVSAGTSLPPVRENSLRSSSGTACQTDESKMVHYPTDLSTSRDSCLRRSCSAEDMTLPLFGVPSSSPSRRESI